MIGPRLTEDIIGQFWRRVFCPGEDECWLFVTRCEPLKYPKISGISVHRLSWYLETGIEPREKQVCHACDTPQCVNPSHLWLGTSGDNYRDSVAKDRRYTRKRNGKIIGKGDHWRHDEAYWAILLEAEEERFQNSAHILRKYSKRSLAPEGLAGSMEGP